MVLLKKYLFGTLRNYKISHYHVTYMLPQKIWYIVRTLPSSPSLKFNSIIIDDLIVIEKYNCVASCARFNDFKVFFTGIRTG